MWLRFSFNNVHQKLQHDFGSCNNRGKIPNHLSSPQKFNRLQFRQNANFNICFQHRCRNLIDIAWYKGSLHVFQFGIWQTYTKAALKAEHCCFIETNNPMVHSYLCNIDTYLYANICMYLRLQ